MTTTDEPVRSSAVVLVAEDLTELRRPTVAYLELAGHHVREAEDGRRALEVADDELDVLVTDIHMPGLGGVELAEQLRERLPWLQVLFVSGTPPPSGIGHFLAKPYAMSELLARVQPLAWMSRALRRSSSTVGPVRSRASSTTWSSTSRTDCSWPR